MNDIHLVILYIVSLPSFYFDQSLHRYCTVSLLSFYLDQSLHHIETISIRLQINIPTRLWATQRYSSQEAVISSDALDAHGGMRRRRSESDDLVSV